MAAAAAASNHCQAITREDIVQLILEIKSEIDESSVSGWQAAKRGHAKVGLENWGYFRKN